MVRAMKAKQTCLRELRPCIIVLICIGILLHLSHGKHFKIVL